MIVNYSDLYSQVEQAMGSDYNFQMSESKIKAIEQVIRAYTHNNFQNRNVRFVAEVFQTENDKKWFRCDKIKGVSPYLRQGDTIQVSQSGVNDGVYRVSYVKDDYIEINEYDVLFPNKYNLITKVEYPADVQQCAIDLYIWSLKYGDKIGIKSESETLSRHSESITYEDSNTLFMGYPIGILNGLSLHKKARF